MKYSLDEKDRNILDKLISEAEEKTNAQIVLATIRRCDNYTEVPWKAFSIGSSLACLVIFLIDLLIFRWITSTALLFSIAAILITGAVFSLLTVFLPRITGLFISGSRMENETFQYAESLFLTRELYATDGRRGILLLVSQFEKQVVILPDKGARSYLDEETLKRIISKMIPYLRKNKISNALETGLNEIVKALCHPLPEGKAINELSNEIIEEEGI
jgi:putative membrane protein